MIQAGEGQPASFIKHVATVAAFLDAVTAGGEPPVTGADALETMRLLHQVYDSAVILRGTTVP
jgi:predicted dehydrogenase